MLLIKLKTFVVYTGQLRMNNLHLFLFLFIYLKIFLNVDHF